jgi:hypothetical protein
MTVMMAVAGLGGLGKGRQAARDQPAGSFQK